MRVVLTALFLCLFIPVFAQKSVIGWLDAGPVASKVYGNLHPRIQLDKYNNPMVVWGDEGGKAYFAKWGGESFTTPIDICQPGMTVFTSSWAGPDIAAHGDSVYVTYKEVTEKNSHIYIKHSYDGGVHFSAAAVVDNVNHLNNRFPTVTTDENGNPFVAFMKSEHDYNGHRYVVARSLDMGETFLHDTLASSGVAPVCDCSPAALVVSGSAGVLLYRNNIGSVRNIWGAVSINGCGSFHTTLRIDSTEYVPETCPASAPHGVIVGDTLYAVYSSGKDENALVYLSRLSLSKPTLSTEALTGAITGVVQQNLPRISGINGAAAIVWTQTDGGNNYVCISITDELAHGFPKSYDTVAMGVMLNADVAIGGGYIYVVWEDQVTRCVMFRRGVYYKKSRAVENTSIIINQPDAGQKAFSIDMEGIVSCELVDAGGNHTETDISYPKNKYICKVMLDDMEPGPYTVKVMDKDGRTYTAQLEIKEIKRAKDKEEK